MTFTLCGAIGTGASDWQWIDRGGVQELGGEAIEADGSVLEVGEGEQDGHTLRRTLLQPMEALLEISQLNFYTPQGQSDCKIQKRMLF